MFDVVLAGGHAGVTLCNEPRGVKVTTADKRDGFYKAGLRRNDVITSINGVACNHHASAVAMIQAATNDELPVTLALTCSAESKSIGTPRFFRAIL